MPASCVKRKRSWSRCAPPSNATRIPAISCAPWSRRSSSTFERLRAVLEISGDVGREIGRLYQEHERRFTLHEQSLIETILRRGQEMGIFRPGNPQRLARGLRGLLAYCEVEIAFDTETTAGQDQVDDVFELLFHGLVSTDLREGTPR